MFPKINVKTSPLTAKPVLSYKNFYDDTVFTE